MDIERTGAFIKEYPKGVPRKKYYTPDGREELKIPQYHTRSDGVVYDVFLTEGYTETPPQNPKLYCAGCDRWHDTQTEVDACIKKRTDFIIAMEKKAQEEMKTSQQAKDKEVADLTAKVDRLTKLLEEKLG